MPRKSQGKPKSKASSDWGHRPIRKPKPKKRKYEEVMAELGAASQAEQLRLRGEFEQRNRKISNFPAVNSEGEDY